MVKAEDLDDYYRIPSDKRSLNYDQYFDLGSEIISQSDEYHSHNTKRLDKEELSDLLRTIPEIKKEISLINE